MGSLWDDIRKSLKEGLETVADYTEEYTKIGRVKVDIASIKHSINRLFGELGGRVYELLSQDPHGQVAPDEKVRALIGRIKELEGKLREKEAEIEKVKQQKQEERKRKTSAAQTPAPEPQAKAAETKPPRRQAKTTARKGQESESDEVVGM